MTVAFRAFFTATFATIKRWKIVFFFFLFNVIFGLLVSLPLISDIRGLAGYFGGLDDFIRSFDPEIYLDFNNHTRSAIGGAASGVWGLVYFGLFNVLTAGAIGILVDPRESTTLKTFFRAGGQFCFRFCRLLVYYVVLLVLIAWINSLFNSAICWYFETSREYGAGSGMLGWTLFAKNMVMIILLGLALLSFNYAKTAAVIENGHFMGYYFLRGMGFTFSHILTTGLFLILSLIPLAAVVLLYISVRKTFNVQGSYLILEGVLPWKWVLPGAAVYIVFAQVIQLLVQACLFFRMAGQVSIFKRYMGQAAYPDPDLHKNIPEAYFVVDSPGTAKAKAEKKDKEEKKEGKIAPALIIILGLCALTAAAQDDGVLSKRVVDYDISAQLDAETWMLDCTENVTFLNTTGSSTSELVFHLYANGHANSESVHQKRSSWAIDFDTFGEEKLGHIDIESVAMADGSPLSDPVTIDDTLMRVPLVRPLAPGERVALKIDFTTKLPYRSRSRSGFIGGHVWVSQWYPKLGVLEETGWVAAPYYPRSEYYGPFGMFEVEVVLPADFAVEGTGKVLNRAVDEDTGTQTVRFRAEDVHDFAWVADRHAELPPPAMADNVEIVRFSQPYAVQKTEQITDAVRDCLALYADWYMSYPYERIVVAGAPHKIPAGMEYPGMINISFQYPTHIDWLAEKVRSPVGLTIHEFTHQYFYGILASNEAAEPWIDEGLTTYTTSKVMDEIYGPGVDITFLSRLEKTILLNRFNDGFGLPYKTGDHFLASVYRFANLANFIGYDESPFHGFGSRTLLGYRVEDIQCHGFDSDFGLWRKEEYFPYANTSPVTAASNEFYPDAYHPIAYSKTALSLETLENHIGRDAMKAILKSFVEKYKFKHPHGEDLLEALAAGAGPEHADLVTQLFTGTGDVDYAVNRAKCWEVKETVGYTTQRAPGDEIVYQAPVVAVEDIVEEDTGEGETAETPPVTGPAREYEWSVIVANKGRVALPVDVEFCFEGGRTERAVFDGKTPFARFEGRSDERLLGAVVDPDHKMALDLNLINNSRTVTYQNQGVLFLSGVAHFWTQNFLNGWAFFN